MSASAESRKGGRKAHQLPPGRHGLPRSFVVHNQRERILAAVAEVCSRHGYPGMSVEKIIAVAGVSRRTFYDHFKNKEDVFLAAFDAIAEQLVTRVREAVETQPQPLERLRAGLDAFLRFVASEPDFARMCIAEVLAAGPAAINRRNGVMRAFGALFEQYATELEPLPLPSPIIAETVVGGVYEVVYARVLRGETEALPELLPDLMYSATVPYLGQEVAAAEYHRLRGGESAQVQPPSARP